MARNPGGLTAIFAPIKCEYCGKTFVPMSGRSKFCGRTCRYKNHKEVIGNGRN